MKYFLDRRGLLSNYSEYMIIKHLFHLVIHRHFIEIIENLKAKIIVLNLKIKTFIIYVFKIANAFSVYIY